MPWTHVVEVCMQLLPCQGKPEPCIVLLMRLALLGVLTKFFFFFVLLSGCGRIRKLPPNTPHLVSFSLYVFGHSGSAQLLCIFHCLLSTISSLNKCVVQWLNRNGKSPPVLLVLVAFTASFQFLCYWKHTTFKNYIFQVHFPNMMELSSNWMAN